MTFYFVRHADKTRGDFYNPRLHHQDQPISSLGRKQAKRLREYFRYKMINSIHVSEYVRTEQTIRPLARKLKLTPVSDARLNEIDLGDLEGLTDQQIREKYPETWQHYLDRNADFRWPGGETGAEAQARIVSFFTDQAASMGDKLIVAHDGIIRLLLCHILKIPVYGRFDFKLGTAGIVEIQKEEDGDQWSIIRINQELM